MNRKFPVEPTNICMIYNNQGNVLVEDKISNDYKGQIFPGGHIEDREPIVDSVIIEIYKETGITASNLEFCDAKDWFHEDGSKYIFYKTNSYSVTIQPST